MIVMVLKKKKIYVLDAQDGKNYLVRKEKEIQRGGKEWNSKSGKS
jgi:hypothetical protein